MDSQIFKIEENPFLSCSIDTSFQILTLYLYEYIKQYVKSTKVHEVCVYCYVYV